MDCPECGKFFLTAQCDCGYWAPEAEDHCHNCGADLHGSHCVWCETPAHVPVD